MISKWDACHTEKVTQMINDKMIMLFDKIHIKKMFQAICIQHIHTAPYIEKKKSAVVIKIYTVFITNY